jgi:hypothetical protein
MQYFKKVDGTLVSPGQGPSYFVGFKEYYVHKESIA